MGRRRSPSPRRRRRRSVSAAKKRSKSNNNNKSATPTPAPTPAQPTEFSGIPGAIGIMIGLPTLVWLAAGVSPSVSLSDDVLAIATDNLSKSLSFRGLAFTFGWFWFQALLHLTVPGPVVKGTVLSDGSRLDYHCNGLRCFIVTLVCVAVCHLYVQSLSWLAHCVLELATAAIVWSFVLSAFMYFGSFSGKQLLAHHGSTGYAVYDFFMGRPLNPRWGPFDWKFFCELRPGLVGWVVLDLAYAAAQFEKTGSVSPSMVLVVLFHTYYVLDSVLNEPCILSTMDITTDGFGFMLAFGDLAWVPFTYTLQAQYLTAVPVSIDVAGLAGIFALHTVGLYIFRSSNSQKDAFRRTPDAPDVQRKCFSFLYCPVCWFWVLDGVVTLCVVCLLVAPTDLTFIKTKTGSRLITNGWWGMARHINYFGDWLMGVSWCLPCGFGSPLPYFYAIYFAVLLIHRERRDDKKCGAKYGEDWQKYCKLVPWRIIPYVY